MTDLIYIVGFFFACLLPIGFLAKRFKQVALQWLLLIFVVWLGVLIAVDDILWDAYLKIKFHISQIEERKTLPFNILVKDGPDKGSKGQAFTWSLTFDYKHSLKNQAYYAHSIWYPDNGGWIDGEKSLELPLPGDMDWIGLIFSIEKFDE